MGNILQVGFISEGKTDTRFLTNIIQKTYDHLAFECSSTIEIYEPQPLEKNGATFVEQVEYVVTKYNYFHVICIHTDADAKTRDNVWDNKFLPAYHKVENLRNEACKNLTAIIPVQMTEAWMLADIELFLKIIGTRLTSEELNLNLRGDQVESISDPKGLINKVLLKINDASTRRRNQINIASLYSIISNELTIDKLSILPSFRAFMADARKSLVKLNYITI